MPFFKVTTDDGKIWVLEWSGVGSILEYIAEFEDPERAKRYVELENEAAGLIQGDSALGQLPSNENAPRKPRTMPFPPGPAPQTSVAGKGNIRTMEGKREVGRRKATNALFAQLSTMADPEGVVEISFANLSRFVGISPASLARYMSVLIEENKISVVRHGDRFGPGIYRIVDAMTAINGHDAEAIA